VQSKARRRVSETEFSSYLMYPKVFIDFAAIEREYGPVSSLPTRVFFYGMQPGDEITVEIEKGKALVVLLQTVGETDAEGQVKVFFELNGQQRIVRIPNRSAAATAPQRPKAQEGNESHVAAPMPGVISTLAVKPGQAVKSGDILLTIEAMKMETALHAPRDGTIDSIHIAPGTQIDAKDLLLVLV
jgi:pyruvate carboxylase